MGDQDKERPSLELPSLLGGRKRSPRKTTRRPATPAAPAAPAGPAAPAEEVAPVIEVAPVADVAPVVAPVATPAPSETAAPPPETVTAPDTQVFEDTAIDDLLGPAEPAAVTTTATATKPKQARQPRSKVPRSERAPLLAGRVAAVVTGLVVGAGLLGLTTMGLQGCQAISGTSSCGTAPGLVGLVVIFALAVVGGRLLLGLFRVPDPGSTSFLAVGLTAVIALLFLVDQLDTWPMLIVIPALSALTYLLSWWVTTTYVEPAGH